MFYLGIDFGTTGVRTGLYDRYGNETGFSSVPYETFSARPGYAEQHPAKPLTQERLQDSWNNFAATLPRQDTPLKNRMINCHPAVISDNAFKVVAGNPMMADEIRLAQDRIINFIRGAFNNSSITMEIEIDQSLGVEHLLTRDEQYAKMKKENPALKELESVFSLELR